MSGVRGGGEKNKRSKWVEGGQEGEKGEINVENGEIMSGVRGDGKKNRGDRENKKNGEDKEDKRNERNVENMENEKNGKNEGSGRNEGDRGNVRNAKNEKNERNVENMGNERNVENMKNVENGKDIENKKNKNKKNQNKDQRFWKNERAIQRAFFRAKRILSAKILARRARVSRATLYRHHKNVYQIMPDVERALIGLFEQQIGEARFKRGIRVQGLFYRMLLFIRKNRVESREVVRRGDERVLEQMVDELMPKIVRSYHIPMKDEEIVRIYQKEIVAVVETWILDDFRESEASVLRDMMYLTRTARQHLMAIGR